MRIKIGDIYDVHNGLSKGREYFGSGHPFLSFSTVFNNYFLPETLNEMVESTETERESFSVKRGDVFITRTSETIDELGMSSVALKDYPYATYNGFTKRLRPKKEGVINPEFIGYYMRTPAFRSLFMAYSTMTTRASLKNENLLSMPLDIPTFEEQTKIAERLRRYDYLIENNRKQIKLLEEAAQRLYKEWFIDLRFPGHENTKIVDGVPEGWRRGRLSSVFELLNGYAFKSTSMTNDGTYKIVTIKNVKTDSFDTSSISYINNVPDNMPEHCVLHEGDILLTLTGNVGRVCVVHDEGCLLNQRVAKVSSKYAAFSYCMMRSKWMFGMMNDLANGTAQQNLSPIRLMGSVATIPSEQVIREFNHRVEPLLKKEIVLSKGNNKLSAARTQMIVSLLKAK